MVVTLTPFNEEGEQEDGEILVTFDEPGAMLEVLERDYDYGAGTTQIMLIGESPGSGTLRLSAADTTGAVEIPYTVLAQ